MTWRKLGRVYAPPGDQWWARQYAHLPTVDVLADRLRVYFAGLDEHNFGRPGYVDLRREDPTQVIQVVAEPILDLGQLGTFDDCGVVPSHVMHHDGKIYFYYVGFQRAERVPYMLFTGLALGDTATGAFTRYAPTPILDRTPAEPYSRSSPFILKEGDTFKMWYWSCQFWSTEAGAPPHYNNVIRHATSADGIHWETHPHLCIVPDFPDEYSAGRPSVFWEAGQYHMYFSMRAHSTPYFIGYATSPDGIHWLRQDHEAGITMSATGWDSEMISYPYIVQVDGQRYMFYNGNAHGKTGFGVAVLER